MNEKDTNFLLVKSIIKSQKKFVEKKELLPEHIWKYLIDDATDRFGFALTICIADIGLYKAIAQMQFAIKERLDEIIECAQLNGLFDFTDLKFAEDGKWMEPTRYEDIKAVITSIVAVRKMAKYFEFSKEQIAELKELDAFNLV